MPLFLALAIIITSILHHNLSHFSVSESQERLAIAADAQRIHRVISELYPIFRNYVWDHKTYDEIADCPLIFTCTYTMVEDDPGYFDTGAWEPALVTGSPSYMFAPYMPAGWDFDFKGYDGNVETAATIHACISLLNPSEYDRRLLVELFRYSSPRTEFGTSCEPATPMNSDQVQTHPIGSPIYITHYLHTF